MVLEQVGNFSALHPYRFWVGLILISIALILLSYWWIALLLRSLKKRKHKKTKSTFIQTELQFDEEVFPSKQATKENLFFKRHWMLFVVFPLFLAAFVVVYTGKQKPLTYPKTENLSLSDSPYIFGIDISHYQGLIDWEELTTSHHPIEFIFIRASMGVDGRDVYFDRNWKKSKEKKYLRGAYHFYRPHENSVEQFNNFKNVVKLVAGDLPPVLDVEHYSKFGSENLRSGVLNWLQLAEAHYGIKPILYTGSNFYNKVLKGYVEDYPLWIADYTRPHHRLDHIDWTFHQFTEKVRIKGIASLVDGNDFRGSMEMLKQLRIEPETTTADSN